MTLFRLLRPLFVLLALCGCLAAQAQNESQKPAEAASAASCSKCNPKPLTDEATATAVVLLCGALVVAGGGTVLWLVARSRGDTRARRWRLSDALSEDVSYTDATGHNVTLLTASSSRLIAVMGLIVILSLYIGMGLLTLHATAVGKAVPDVVETMLKFLVGGAGLFLPYLANQVRAGLEKKASLPVPGSGTSTATNLPAMKPLPAGPKVST